MEKRLRLIALLMCLGLLLCLSASSVYLAKEAGHVHTCHEENCEICEQIKEVANIQHGFRMAFQAFCPLFALLILFSGFLLKKQFIIRNFNLPVFNKVRLNN